MSAINLTRVSLAATGTPLYTYLLEHQPPEHAALQRLRAATLGMERDFMQIAPDQGHFMAFLVKALGARRILELGTFTGYSALAMALALPGDGRLVTCDDVAGAWDEFENDCLRAFLLRVIHRRHQIGRASCRERV